MTKEELKQKIQQLIDSHSTNCSHDCYGCCGCCSILSDIDYVLYEDTKDDKQ